MNTTTQQKGATTKKYVSDTLTALANVAEMRPHYGSDDPTL